MVPGTKCGRFTHYRQNQWTNKEIPYGSNVGFPKN